MAAKKGPGFDDGIPVGSPLLGYPNDTGPKLGDDKIDPNPPNDPGDGPINPYAPGALVVVGGEPPPEDTEVPPVGSGGVPGIIPSPGIDPLLAPTPVSRPSDSGLPTATTRVVTDDELVENRLGGLLAGGSKFMRQARQRGLELGGGLGGTSGIQAAYGAAIAAGMPIAIADAQAFRDAASESMQALNQFGLANIQRRTQLDLGVMDSNTRLQTAHMNNVAQANIAKMQDITNRDIASLNADTQIYITELNGTIQKRLADAAFRHSQILNNELAGYNLEQEALRGEYRLADTDLQGQYNLEQESIRQEAARENNYTQMYMGAYDGTLSRIAALNGLDIDDNARQRAEDAIWEGFYNEVDLIEALFPDVPPMEQPGS